MKIKNKKIECCEKTDSKKYDFICNCGKAGASNGAIYGLSVIGVLFYFLGNATSFGMVMIGIGKAIFWPAFLMFKLLTYLGM
jgi:uncharacterized membrane protein